jgi:O-antigen ligase
MSGTATTIGCVLGAVGGALALVPRTRAALLAGLASLAAGMAVLGYALVPGKDVDVLVSSPARIGAVVVAAVALVGVGLAVARRPAIVPVLALMAAPFRVKVELGTSEAFLLIPLYAVLVVAVVALTARVLRGEEVPALPRVLSVPAALFVALAAISLTWTGDLRAGTIELLFFLFPFVVLLACLARSPLAGWTTRALAVTEVALACGFATVGLSQLWTGELYFARDLEVANAYTSYFRTTSLFADSSIYARELALGIMVLVVALWLRNVGYVVALALIALLWTGIFFSYSQSTMVSLVVSLLVVSVIAADRLNRRVIVVSTLACVVVAAVVVGLASRDQTANRFTSGRSSLVENTWQVFVDNPSVGVGIGGQPLASRELGGKRQTERNASHATPLTVAAELGVVGLAAFVAFLAGAAVVLLRALRQQGALGLGLLGAFVLLFVHALFYSGFFENPTVWGVLGVAAAATARLPASELVQAPGILGNGRPAGASTSPFPR